MNPPLPPPPTTVALQLVFRVKLPLDTEVPTSKTVSLPERKRVLTVRKLFCQATLGEQ